MTTNKSDNTSSDSKNRVISFRPGKELKAQQVMNEAQLLSAFEQFAQTVIETERSGYTITGAEESARQATVCSLTSLSASGQRSQLKMNRSEEPPAQDEDKGGVVKTLRFGGGKQTGGS